MSNTKAVVLDNIHIEVWKIRGERGIEWFIKLFNEVPVSNQMSGE